jgi:hypothetical protein
MAAAVMRFHLIVSNAIRAASADEGGRVSSCMFYKAKRAAQGVVAGAELLHAASPTRRGSTTWRQFAPNLLGVGSLTSPTAGCTGEARRLLRLTRPALCG